MKVFICWSGERSQKVAETLREWLKRVIQQLDPWVSSEDIQAGVQWIPEITDQLAKTKIGILCLTPENLKAPWLNFEAGALAKTVDDRAHVCPYLVQLTPTDVPMPLGLFQSKRADEEGTFDLLRTINSCLGDSALKPDVLKDTFKTFWPRLKEVLDGLPAAPTGEERRRDTQDMVKEILDTVRGLTFIMQKRGEIVPSFFPESLSELVETTGVVPTTWADVVYARSKGSKVMRLIEETCKALLKKEELKKKAEIP
jgi:hypothetical protein